MPRGPHVDRGHGNPYGTRIPWTTRVLSNHKVKNIQRLYITVYNFFAKVGQFFSTSVNRQKVAEWSHVNGRRTGGIFPSCSVHICFSQGTLCHATIFFVFFFLLGALWRHICSNQTQPNLSLPMPYSETIASNVLCTAGSAAHHNHKFNLTCGKFLVPQSTCGLVLSQYAVRRYVDGRGGWVARFEAT